MNKVIDDLNGIIRINTHVVPDVVLFEIPKDVPTDTTYSIFEYENFVRMSSLSKDLRDAIIKELPLTQTNQYFLDKQFRVKE